MNFIYTFFITVFTTVLVLGASENAQASEDQVTNPVHTDWYRPQFVMTLDQEKARVFLTGKTRQGASIEIDGNELIVMTKQRRIKKVDLSNETQKPQAFADERGHFDLPLDLELGTYQIPVKVTYPSGESRSYLLPIIVKERDASVAEQTDLENSPFGRRNWSLWAGSGMNLLIYEQINTDIGSSLEIQSIAGPSLHLKGTKTINRQMALSLTYNYSPGKTKSSESVQVLQEDFKWSFYTAEVNYFPPSWKYRSFDKYFTEVGAQIGLQQHVVPFMARSDINEPSITSVTKNDLTMVAAGMTFLMHYNRYFLFEGFARYQYPVATGDLFAIEPTFAFDGSVGVIYKWKKDLRIGGFWYGQWHKYKFNNHEDTYFAANPLDGSNPTSGRQSLFFTNLEVRLGFEFD